VWYLVNIEVNSTKNKLRDVKKLLPINQLNNKVPDKSHATVELVGYKLSSYLEQRKHTCYGDCKCRRL